MLFTRNIMYTSFVKLQSFRIFTGKDPNYNNWKKHNIPFQALLGTV